MEEELSNIACQAKRASTNDPHQLQLACVCAKICLVHFSPRPPAALTIGKLSLCEEMWNGFRNVLKAQHNVFYNLVDK